MENTSNKQSIYSQAQVIGVLADGYRLLLICNHLLDNTTQPKIDDFVVRSGGQHDADGEEKILPVKAAFLASPMLQSSSWAAITLMLNQMVPKNASLRVEYKQPLHIGLLSLVDKKRLAPIYLRAWCNHSGAVSLQPGDSLDSLSDAPVEFPQVAFPASRPSAVNLTPLHVLQNRLNVEDAAKVQDELFCEYVDSLFDDIPCEDVFDDGLDTVAAARSSVAAARSATQLDESGIPTLTLVAPNPDRPLPVKLTRVTDDGLPNGLAVDLKKSDQATSQSTSSEKDRAAREKHEGILQALFSNTTGLMLGRGALIRSK